MRLNQKIFLLFLMGLLFSACRSAPVPAPSPTVSPLPQETVSAVPTDPAPTATPEALAVTVNGEGIALAEYQAELLRYQDAAKVDTLTPEDGQRVLDELINQTLLAQAAAENGLTPTAEAVDQRLTALESARGTQAFEQWLQRNHYTRATFRSALARSLAAAAMRDQIQAQIPAEIEQTHARQIAHYDSVTMQQVETLLKQGSDFDTLAAQYDPFTLGELGWFPPGYLLQPELESAIAALQPGETSAIIQTEIGYHIVRVLAREPHPLTAAAAEFVQQQTLTQWLQTRRAQSKITLMLP
ncbi:MAG: hypothetical protein OHK0052_19550 [Anaerolineales bacterium]